MAVTQVAVSVVAGSVVESAVVTMVAVMSVESVSVAVISVVPVSISVGIRIGSPLSVMMAVVSMAITVVEAMAIVAVAVVAMMAVAEVVTIAIVAKAVTITVEGVSISLSNGCGFSLGLSSNNGEKAKGDDSLWKEGSEYRLRHNRDIFTNSCHVGRLTMDFMVAAVSKLEDVAGLERVGGWPAYIGRRLQSREDDQGTGMRARPRSPAGFRDVGHGFQMSAAEV